MGFQVWLEMPKGSRARRRIASRQSRLAPYSIPAYNQHIATDLCSKKCSKILDKKDWEDVTCSVCMECPHNAVLLLCSSHDKGCHPYMCGTSFRYSNCLDQYKKAYAKSISSTRTADNPILVSDSSWPVEKCEATELACPLCRGQDDCSFVGTYKELRKHMRANHPSAQPRAVDPILEQKWRGLEGEFEHDDVISTIQSTMPGAMVFGDYVIEGGHYGFDTDEDGVFDADAAERNEGLDMGFNRNLVNVFLLLHAFGSTGDDHGRRPRHQHAERIDHQMTDESAISIHHSSPDGGLGFSYEDDDNNSDDGGVSLVSRLHRHGRMLLGRSGRRRRRREEGIGGSR
ncbi:FINGER/BTB DOMAIN PROTEIN putative (DUF1644)-RELATED [Salix purpurea]|uniref:FINGER/BTB DOMAIN PROTEIN putative (DUF1644)-RELATED n=1 Tax=Salix purpurea TaxID=77065 RepID=A0A9Q0TGX2_SALPP|nr:FINGER/BTB DOMAIN PROTEIN putative (DUF1644)-RELATED [Salix purpurea]